MNLKFTTSFITKILFIVLITYTFNTKAQCLRRYVEPVFKEVSYLPNIKYGTYKENTDGTHTWLVYDVYEPKGDTVKNRPLIILIHGGSFTNWPPIDRRSPDIGGMAKALAERGYVVISPNYRVFSGDQTFQKMAETIFAAAFDIDELFCYLKNDILFNNNPHRIDIDKIFLGGSSAGAVLALNYGLFLDDISDLDFNPVYKDIMLKVAAFDGIDINEKLHDKMCGIVPQGYISVSGALIDTNIIKPKDAHIYQLHGKMDLALPYTTGFPLGNPNLPKLFGPGLFINKLIAAGIHVEADIYDDKYHVPVILPYGDNIPLAIELFLKTGDIYDRPVLDSTIKRISNFCYEIMGNPSEQDCDSTLTGIKKNVITNQLNVYPNPSGGIFNLEMPQDLKNKETQLFIYDINGKIVYHNKTNFDSLLKIDISKEPKGIYWIILKTEKANGLIYLHKIILQ